jgi:fatty acid desaturase
MREILRTFKELACIWTIWGAAHFLYSEGWRFLAFCMAIIAIFITTDVAYQHRDK